MNKIVCAHKLFLIGKVSDLLKMLDGFTKSYTTVQELIDDHLKI